MKKKTLSILIAVLALCTCMFTLTACFGNEPPHTHVFDREVIVDDFKASDATCEDKATYFYSCYCGEKGTLIFEDGLALGHAYGEGVSNNDGTHTKTCANDNSHTITENCSGGEATCTEKAKCSGCNQYYGIFAEHTYSTKWTISDTHHYQESTCGCDVKKDYGTHTADESGFCSLCELPISATEGLNIVSSNDGNYAEVIGYRGNSEKVNIPATYNNLPVKIIRSEAFAGISITKIVISDSVTSIGDNAFYECYSLTSIEIPDSVTSIGDGAFQNCQALASIAIGENVASIGDEAFSGNYLLTDISVNANNANFKDIDGNLYSKDGKTLIQYAIGKTATEYVIADDVTKICSRAFNYCESLTSVVIGNGVKSIDSSAFEDCHKLTSVVIGNGVESIGSHAFYFCNSLESIEIPNSVTSIGSHAFRYCYSLTRAKIGNSVESIGEGAFYNCNSLELIEILNGVTSIGSHAFAHCSKLTSVEIPNSVTSIDAGTFYACSSLTSVIIGNRIERIASLAFKDCSSLNTVYYGGTATEWAELNVSSLANSTIYYYVGNESDLPGDNGNYWHYVDGVPTIWQKD